MIAPPSRRHWIEATPDAASEPETVVVKLVLRQPCVTAGVVLVGLVRSTLTVSERHTDALPALSTMRVCSVEVPSTSTTAGVPEVGSAVVPIRHSA